jgi:hypothetical protein
LIITAFWDVVNFRCLNLDSLLRVVLWGQLFYLSTISFICFEGLSRISFILSKSLWFSLTMIFALPIMIIFTDHHFILLLITQLKKCFSFQIRYMLRLERFFIVYSWFHPINSLFMIDKILFEINIFLRFEIVWLQVFSPFRNRLCFIMG